MPARDGTLRATSGRQGLGCLAALHRKSSLSALPRPYDLRKLLSTQGALPRTPDDRSKGRHVTMTPTAVPTPVTGKAHASEQPIAYPPTREFVEPDWTRLPAYRDVTREQWADAQ